MVNIILTIIKVLKVVLLLIFSLSALYVLGDFLYLCITDSLTKKIFNRDLFIMGIATLSLVLFVVMWMVGDLIEDEF